MSEEESKLIFQQKFNNLLREKDITQREIAKICGVSTSTVSTWSQGQNMPRMGKIEILANYFGVPKSYFIEKASPVPHASYREILSEGGIRLLLDEDANVPTENIEDIIKYIKLRQGQVGR